MGYELFKLFVELVSRPGFWASLLGQLLLVMHYEKKIALIHANSNPTENGGSVGSPISRSDIICRLQAKGYRHWEDRKSSWWRRQKKTNFTFIAGSRRRKGYFAVRRDTDSKVFVVG